jgi:hemerythrin-like domain-containing protein
MEKLLQTPIKELIGRFSAVGEILDEVGIGCVPCSVGTCLLADIVEIHNLPSEEERDLMARIAAVVFPGEVVKLPESKRAHSARTREIRYSPPIKGLVEEHKVIKRFVALLPEVVRKFDVRTVEGRELILAGADFIRSFADRYHHAKEEEILFTRFEEKLDILQVMQDDHRRARACVKELLEAVERRDPEGVERSLAEYAAILTEHIKKEDEILYPWMDRNLSTHQIGELFARFREVDDAFREARKRYEEFVDNLEKTLQTRSREAIR